MRYLNWDVLLFPEQSRVPLREFRTTCHVTSESYPIQIQENTPQLRSTNPVNQRQLPIVTCFVPALQHGCPFRVSLHTWGEPEVSRGTQALTSPEDCIFFEARVLLDGVYTGGLILNNHGPWPQAIDTCANFDESGHQECLRFPPFRQEMLLNTWWSAGEDLGRVKVVITEGLARSQGPPTAFRRIKNVVSFSFQHAPLAILEESCIAWPNAAMWDPASQQPCMPSSPSRMGTPDPDAHAHSPRRRNASDEVSSIAAVATMPPRLLSQALMPPPATRSGQTGEPKWAATARTPYHVEARNHQAPRRSTTHMSASDISMPDYSHSVTPTSSRDPSLHDVHQPFDGSFPQQPSQFEEFIAALSPAKASGTQAPPTTRVSSAANSPPSTALRQSEGPEVRVISYHTQPRATSLTTLDAPPPSARGPSELSMNPRLFELEAGEMEARPRIVATPSKEVKGRKEGKSNEVDPLLSTDARKTLTGSGSRRPKSSRNASENHAIPESDGKRKRVSMTPIPNVLSEMSDGPGSSPSRKVSKKGLQDRVNSSGDSPQYPGTVVRAPLGTLHNI